MEIIYNKSITFILPMLYEFEPRFLINNYFRGCFVGDIEKKHKNCIYTLYEFSAKKEFLMFESVLRSSLNFIESYEPDKYHTMYVFKVPNSNRINYNLILEGKYSKTSLEYKQSVLRFVSVIENTDSANEIAKILRKDESKIIEWENIINKGLPLSMWTIIPKDQECSSLMILDPDSEFCKDIYTDKYKVKKALEKYNYGKV